MVVSFGAPHSWLNIGLKLTINSGARANLVLPLRGHDLGVDTGDVHTSEKTSLKLESQLCVPS